MPKSGRFIKISCLSLLLTWATGWASQPVVETNRTQAGLEKISGGCPIAQTADTQGEPVWLWQQVFDDGTHDLAMARTAHGELLDIRRVTFGGSQQAGCHFPGLAIARGGDWGWHLAWTVANSGDKPALRYARMDGAAWVSSSAKRFGNASAHAPQLSLSDGKLALSWQQLVDGKPQSMVLISEDEGRSWR